MKKATFDLSWVWSLAVAMLSLALPGALRAATVSVNIINFGFSPDSVTINAGDTVTWTQKDSTQHTSTSDTILWNSPLLSLNQTFSHTFEAAGTFPYHCVPHPFMTGTVIVQAAPVNQPPVVSISSPANGATFTDPNIVLEATASDPDGSIAKVQFFEGRTSLGVASTSPYRVTVSLPVGTHNLTAQATDNQGATSTSAVVTVTVIAANNPPTVALTSPTEGEHFTAPATITLAAQATDSDGSISKVEFFAGETLLGAATTSPFTFTWNNVAAGEYALTAKATDNQGTTTLSAPVHVSVSPPSATAPTVSNATRTADGTFLFTVAGTVGQVYLVQASADLTSWADSQTIIAPADTFTVTNTPAASVSLQFYRVQLKP